MPSEQLRFWLEAIGSIAGIVALAAIALELQRARRADEREFLFQAYEKFSGLHRHRVVVEGLESMSFDDFGKSFNDEKTRESLVSIYNFWDLLTRTVKDKSINSKSAVEHFGRIFMVYYVKFSPIHHKWREIEGNSDWFKSFDWFADEYMRLLPGDWEAAQKRINYRG